MSQQELKEAGLKVTTPRLKILKLLDNSKQQHMSAEDVYRSLLEQNEEIGLATVYRVLSQFEQAGLVHRHHFEEDRSVFERNHGHHHDHMVDVDTGKVIEFVNEDIEELQSRIAAEAGYELVDHELVLYVRKKKSS